MTDADFHALSDHEWPQDRPLEGHERLFEGLHDDMGPDCIVGRLDGPVTVDKLRVAAGWVIRRHPIVRAAIEDHARLRFPPADPGAVLVARYTEQDWADDAESGPLAETMAGRPLWERCACVQMMRPFADGQSHMLRLLWVPDGGYLVVCTHHSLTDGSSLFRILLGILTQLQRQGEGVDVAAEPVEPLDSRSCLHFVRPRLWQRAAMQLARFVWVFMAHTASPVTPRAQPESRECTPALRAQMGDPEAFQRLYARCKAERVTVGGAVLAAAYFALLAHTRDKLGAVPADRGGRACLVVENNYNVRKSLGGVSNEHVGLWVGTADLEVPVRAGDSFWDVARAMKEQCTMWDRTLNWPVLYQILTDIDFKAFSRRWCLNHYKNGGGAHALNVSSVGKWPHEEDFGEFGLREVYGFNNLVPPGTQVVFWARNVRGRMTYNAVSSAQAMGVSAMDTFVERAVGLLEGGCLEEGLTAGAFAGQFEAKGGLGWLWALLVLGLAAVGVAGHVWWGWY